nr:hypothetical protein CTI12_AA406300 [Tanacetum cinerariifolium]
MNICSPMENSSIALRKKGRTINMENKKHYIDHGDPIFICESCDALLWHAESMIGNTHASSDSFSLCCGRGKVKLGNEAENPPKLLMDLINGNHPKSTSFIDNIRRYNSMFAFTSIDAKQDMSVNQGHGTYCYRIQGENYHRMGTLLPDEGNPLMFAQLYIYDTQNEIDNRIKCVSNDDSTSTNNKVIDHQLTVDLRDMLDNINPLVSQFRMAGECLVTSNDENKFKIRLIGTRTRDGRDYNLPTASEVVALIVGDFDSTINKRDIILHTHEGGLKRICELHPSYLALQYPLLYPDAVFLLI